MFRLCIIFFFRQKTAYEMRISDWSSDVCSSDLYRLAALREAIPNICLQMLLRGRNTVGYTPYPEKVTRAFVQEATDTGIDIFRSEERRVGKECVSTCISRWSPHH